jgi:hypothetical protein
MSPSAKALTPAKPFIASLPVLLMMEVPTIPDPTALSPAVLPQIPALFAPAQIGCANGFPFMANAMGV